MDRSLPFRSFQRRAVLRWLPSVLGFSLVVLYIAWRSHQRLELSLSVVQNANVKLQREKLETEVHRRVMQQATECLRDAAPADLSRGEPDGPAAARHIRKILEGVRKRHRIASELFVMHKGSLRFPRVRSSGGPLLEELYRQPEFAELFTAAEVQEIPRRSPKLALMTYRQCYALEVPASLKALALARAARCLQKLERFDTARQTYEILGRVYADRYDPFGRPYALIAGFEIGSTDQLRGLFQDLIAGRWELSAEQMDYFLSRFRDRLGKSVPAAETRYANQFRFARDLDEGFRHQGSLHKGEVYTYTFRAGNHRYRMFYTAVDAEIIVGFAADLKWIQNELLPQARRELELSDPDNDPVSSGRETWIFRLAFGLTSCAFLLSTLLLLRDLGYQAELNRARSDLVSGISHELKSPLQWIRSYAETLLLRREVPAEDRDAYHRLIMYECDRQARSIDNVLQFQRIDQGRQQYQFEEADAVSVIGGVLRAYTPYLKAKGFEIETHLTRTPPLRLDSDAVTQAVLILLDNAVKYSEDYRFLGVRLWCESGEAILEIDDHGVGIPQEEQEKIFEQFYRVRNGSAKGGSGLGLFLVRHTMESHGGRVEVSSKIDSGSRFRLVFPIPCQES